MPCAMEITIGRWLSVERVMNDQRRVAEGLPAACVRERLDHAAPVRT